MAHEGHVEQICYPSAESERNTKYHIALVRVPGEDDYEVGLKALYKKLEVNHFSNNTILSLMESRPTVVTFEGCDIHYPLRLHTIEITDTSAEEWVRRLNSRRK